MSLHDYKEYNRLVCHLYRISKGQRTTVWIGARRGDVSTVMALFVHKGKHVWTADCRDPMKATIVRKMAFFVLFDFVDFVFLARIFLV